MAYLPAMTFPVDALMDTERMKNGPLEVYYGQDGWIERVGDRPIAWRPVPRRKWWRFRQRLWRIEIRFEPPTGTDLHEWGGKIAEKLGTTWSDGPPRSTQKAVWLPAMVWARDAPSALASAAVITRQLDGIYVARMQIWVQLAPPDDGAVVPG